MPHPYYGRKNVTDVVGMRVFRADLWKCLGRKALVRRRDGEFFLTGARWLSMAPPSYVPVLIGAVLPGVQNLIR